MQRERKLLTDFPAEVGDLFLFWKDTHGPSECTCKIIVIQSVIDQTFLHSAHSLAGTQVIEAMPGLNAMYLAEVAAAATPVNFDPPSAHSTDDPEDEEKGMGEGEVEEEGAGEGEEEEGGGTPAGSQLPHTSSQGPPVPPLPPAAVSQPRKRKFGDVLASCGPPNSQLLGLTDFIQKWVTGAADWVEWTHEKEKDCNKLKVSSVPRKYPSATTMFLS